MSDFLICSSHDVESDGLLNGLIEKIKKLKPKIILWWNAFEYIFPANVIIEEFFKLEKILIELDIQFYIIFGSVEPIKHKEIYPQKNFNYMYWPTFQLSQMYHIIKNNVENFNLKEFVIEKDFKNLFICYNHNPHLHRCMLIDNLFKNDLFKYGRISWNKLIKDFNDHPVNYSFKHWKEEYLKIDDYNKDGHRLEITNMLLKPMSFFNLICETDNKYLIFTEKTWRTILIEQPFLSLGAQYQNLKLKEYGFELYDEIFDYTFDENPNLEDRVDGVIKNIISLKDKNFDKLYSLIEVKIKHNKNRAIDIIENDSYIPNNFVDLFKLYKNEFDFNKNKVIPHNIVEILKNK